jgi:hypothetical protein
MTSLAGGKKIDADGQSLVPVLKGVAAAQRTIFWHYPHYANQGGPPGGAVRSGDWKLIEWYEDGKVELFNLREDIGEEKDRSKELPEKTEELKKMLEEWRKSVAAQMPGRRLQ